MEEEKKRKKIALIVIALILTIALIIALFFILRRVLDSDTSSQENSNIKIGEHYYREKNLANFLIMGIDDRDQIASSNSYSNDTQADFIAILSMDYSNQEYFIYTINRDTMCDVNLVDVNGNVSGVTANEQIALSHSQGDGLVSSAISVRRTVENLFKDLGAPIGIDYYISLNMNGIGIIDDTLGGVTLTMDQDYTDISPEYTEDAMVTLNGDEALKFVTSRIGLKDPTNVERMHRQKLFINALIDTVKNTNLSEDSEFYEDLYTTLTTGDTNYLLSDVNINSADDFMDDLKNLTFKGIDSMQGDANYDEEYVKFYPDETAFLTYAIDHYLTKVS